MTIENVMPLFEGDFFSMRFLDDETSIPLELNYNKTEYGENYSTLAEMLVARLHIVGMAVGEFYVDLYNGFDHMKMIDFTKERFDVSALTNNEIFDKIMGICLRTLYVDKEIDEEFNENVELFLDMLEYMDLH